MKTLAASSRIWISIGCHLSSRGITRDIAAASPAVRRSGRGQQSHNAPSAIFSNKTNNHVCRWDLDRRYQAWVLIQSGCKGGPPAPMPLSGSDTRVDFAPTSTDICILFFLFFPPKNFCPVGFCFFQNFTGGRSAGRGCRCQRRGHLRIMRAGVLGAWSPSLLRRESITTPFGFLGAIVVQRLKRQFRM